MEKKINSKSTKAFSLKENAILKHVLSPLEHAVMQGKNKPFVYNLDGIDFYVSRATSKQLLLAVQQKMELIFTIYEKNKKSINIPIHLRETFDDPRIVLGLPPVLRNRLCKLECYTVYAIMLKGRNYFKEEQNFSSQSMKMLDELFSKYKCGDLF